MTTKPKPKAKAKAKPKPKAAAKPPAESTQATNQEGNTSMSTTQEAPAAAPKQAAKRDYRITRELKLDVTDPPSLLTQLEAFKDEDGSPLTVYVLVGTGKGVNPPAALKQYGADNDLDGDYELVAVASVNEFKNVKTATKRDVSFG